MGFSDMSILELNLFCINPNFQCCYLSSLIRHKSSWKTELSWEGILSNQIYWSVLIQNSRFHLCFPRSSAFSGGPLVWMGFTTARRGARLGKGLPLTPVCVTLGHKARLAWTCLTSNLWDQDRKIFKVRQLKAICVSQGCAVFSPWKTQAHFCSV